MDYFSKMLHRRQGSKLLMELQWPVNHFFLFAFIIFVLCRRLNNLVNFLVFSDASGAGSERRRSSSRGVYANSNNSKHEREPGNVKFTMEEINKATKNFSPSFKIGQGGFGIVYKGRLEDGTFVAIKRAKKVG